MCVSVCFRVAIIPPLSVLKQFSSSCAQLETHRTFLFEGSKPHRGYGFECAVTNVK